MDKIDWHKNKIDDGTIITDSYKTTQNVRRYLKKQFGDDFKFNRELMAWMKSAVGQTMLDACDEIRRRQRLK